MGESLLEAMKIQELDAKKIFVERIEHQFCKNKLSYLGCRKRDFHQAIKILQCMYFEKIRWSAAKTARKGTATITLLMSDDFKYLADVKCDA